MPDILVIDDEPAIRKVLRNILERSGYDVLTAESGVKGLQVFEARRPNLTITDLIMPDKEGLELIREMKAIDPDAKIIAMSGGGFGKAHTYLKLAERFGAASTFVKPVDAKEMISIIQSLLNA